MYVAFELFFLSSGFFLPTAWLVFGRHSAMTRGHNRVPSKYRGAGVALEIGPQAMLLLQQ